ncbi:MAG TPA: hypothetical protein VM621_10075 [Luteibacter sp.]|uniref:hypothetical protein n=1 Tax=Luteibacter sp. TaxID=1886636 RepID=UPI002C2E7D1A|nr:hypothetical protein [Luteibacter sp.]HVI55387.1 hypothetical protein [Luteibacter sp.]
MSRTKLTSKLRRSVATYGLAGSLSRAAREFIEAMAKFLRDWRDHHGTYRLEGEPKGLDVGVVVLAGYKPSLWPLTLARIRKFVPSCAEVCVTTAGKRVPELAELCKANGWTYLTTSANKTGLALNKVIDTHPSATRWFKLDEDVFVAAGFFDGLMQGYEAIVNQGSYRPGFCAPMLNVNGISYAGFLERIDAADDYKAIFGDLRQACDGIPAHYDPRAAEWLWRRTLPLDEVAARMTSGIAEPLAHARLIGTRFSIGAILFEREFWKAFGGFTSTWRQGILGVDETGICTACMLASRPMYYMTNILAGHFSFYPQERAMMDLLPEFAKIDPASFGTEAGRHS